MEQVKSSFIDGVWRTKPLDDPSSVSILNPWDGEVVFQYAEPDALEVAEAIAAAQKTAKTVLAPRLRAEILERISELLAKRVEEGATILARETGKPIRDSRMEVRRALQNFRMSSEEAARIHGYTEEQDQIGDDRVLSITVQEPLGVVCAITPFNFPLNITALKIGPALAAGNSVVWKPADATPATAAFLMDLMTEAGLPPGYVNLLLGGSRVGQALVADPRIALYTFTGSVGVGRQIKEQSGLRPVILELGSNAPNVVHGDADLDLAVEGLVKAAFSFAGQVCVSAQRIYVQARIFNAFLERFVTRVRQLTVGNPLDEATDVGPLINEQAAIRVEQWVRAAVANGAVAMTDVVRQGNVLHPIVLTQVRPDMDVMCNEAFGPVVNVLPYESVEEVIGLCNDSDFGLQAGVFTKDLNVALAIARGLHIGSVNINQTSIARPDSMPYGGVKNSGIGKEGARASIAYMTMTKVITLRHPAFV